LAVPALPGPNEFLLKRLDRDIHLQRAAVPIGVISFQKWSDIYSSLAIHKEQLRNAAPSEHQPKAKADIRWLYGAILAVNPVTRRSH
jgi:hypothetical protein